MQHLRENRVPLAAERQRARQNGRCPRRRHLRRREPLLLVLLAAAALSLACAFLLRFEFAVPISEKRSLDLGLCIFVPVKGMAFYLFGIHKRWWGRISLFDLKAILLANLAGSLVSDTLAAFVIGPRFPRSIYILDALLCFLLTVGVQVSIRLYREVLVPSTRSRGATRRILIYGAGAAGLTLAKEIRSNPKLSTRVAGFLDDDGSKYRSAVFGVPVLGSGRDAARIVSRFKRRHAPVAEIVIAMPSATGREMRAAVANCRAAGIPFKTVPSLGELLDGKVHTRQLREVSVNDLLGREPVQIDEEIINDTVRGRSVLVTGGCGSIGSELCRQLALFAPRRLVIFDQAESEMFMLALELRSRHPGIDLACEVGDICRESRVNEVIRRHGTEILFHAAAYKHVPLMEANIIEAVENNVIGTLNVARAAHRNAVRNFVLISSDKAVNPTSVMGTTKRISELIVSAMPLDGSPRVGTFVSVRFGNVLASAGSVVRIFQRQIAAGGPVTITHPDMRRYFMSIPEAVQLVLQASSMGKGSEVFVLDMGEPVKILELARNMIRLAGLVPEEDIAIRFTGMRPGEKLFEELKLGAEDILPTHHPKIKVFQSCGIGREYLAQWLADLAVLLKSGDSSAVKAHLVKVVPEYRASREEPIHWEHPEPLQTAHAHG